MTNLIIIGAGRGLFFADLIGRDEFQQAGRHVCAIVEPVTVVHDKLRQELDHYNCHNTVICTTTEEVLQRFGPEEAQAVIIVTPNNTHADLLELCLKNKRHVLLEKPVEADWANAVRIAKLSSETDQVVQLGFVLHYSHYYRKVKEIIDAGKLGKLVNMQFNIRRGLDTEFMRGWRRLTVNTGGLLNEKCSHDLDIIRWLKKEQAEPTEVFSFGGQEFFPRAKNMPHKYPEKCSQCQDTSCPFRLDLASYESRDYNLNPQYEALDTCVYHTDADLITDQCVLIKFADNTHCSFNMTAISGDDNRDIIIHGTEGYLAGSLKEGQLHLTTYRDGRSETFNLVDANHDFIDMHGNGDLPIIREFFDCIDRNQAPAASVLDGVMASRLAFAADLSLKEGRKVNISELPISG